LVNNVTISSHDDCARFTKMLNFFLLSHACAAAKGIIDGTQI